ncbi:MAG: hypothetical protein Q9213_001450 [Squamulea squamosa]
MLFLILFLSVVSTVRYPVLAATLPPPAPASQPAIPRYVDEPFMRFTYRFGAPSARCHSPYLPYPYGVRVQAILIRSSLSLYPRLPTASYDVPGSYVRVKLTAQTFYASQMPPESVNTLIDTGQEALDHYAALAGSPSSALDRPRLSWHNVGLTILIHDGTVRNPQPAGGPFRYDEMKHVFAGVQAIIGEIEYRECTIAVWRISRTRLIKRKVKFLGYGSLVRAVIEKELGGNKTSVSVG